MNVDIMRKIDLFVGVPLCFVVTLLYRLNPFSRRRKPDPIRRVLFIELSEMGSAILADPAMRKIRRRAGAELFFLIFRSTRPSLELLQTVPAENIFTLRGDRLWTLAWDTVCFILWTRRQRIDTVIDLELFSRITALLTALSGAARRVGFHRFHTEGLYRGNFLTHRVSYNPHVHIAKNFIALVNAALSPTPEYPYSKTLIKDDELVLAKAAVTDLQQTAVRDRVLERYPRYRSDVHRLVLVNTNASAMLIQRRWPPDHFRRLIQTILNRYDNILILLTGDPGEAAEAETLKQAVDHPRCVNFAGGIAFHQLPALYAISAFMLTNDSGPPHFAAVTDMPTFVLFGPETPHLYRSLGRTTPIYAGLACSPCVSAANHRKTSCTENRCLQAITPEQVFEILEPSLETCRE
ncbi:MAG: glycosyltransferase family 9 protein [Syntrophales bacterium]|mgnify:FL=1|nr:glycosyltransferase family 9 protein [Syntrophales bacterium]MDD4338263.1 glycosyltransferase family 9 protein [Syntrophales bacterium]HQN24841.1 glycosyltransferase family 9 protein [Syntrophales bacterium]HQP28665.1 glycosyltransferase family 9 protein [Syntrophales bacterium]